MAEQNRLFATFSVPDNLDTLVDILHTRYSVLSGRVFVLESTDTPELICTYGVDMNNLSDDGLLDNTILVHRNKEFNVLYSINALNALITDLNGNIDHSYKVDWSGYKNSLLLTREGEFTKLRTKLKDILYLN